MNMFVDTPASNDLISPIWLLPPPWAVKLVLILGVILAILGIIGIVSILTMEIQLPPEAGAILKDKFTPEQIKLLTLINPTIMLIVAVVVGTILYQRVTLKVPLISCHRAL